MVIRIWSLKYLIIFLYFGYTLKTKYVIWQILLFFSLLVIQNFSKKIYFLIFNN
jgi:hypothetical protein